MLHAIPASGIARSPLPPLLLEQVQEAQQAVQTSEGVVRERDAALAAREQQLAQERARVAALQVGRERTSSVLTR